MALRLWLRRSVPLLASILCLPLVAGAEPEASGRPESPEDAEPAEDENGRAARVVDQLHSALLDVMQNADSLGYEGRHEKLAPVLSEVFDIPYMAQKSVGRHWKRADATKREKLVATFTRFTIANYAGRFDGYSGQNFETFQEEPSLRETVLVHSRLIESGSEPVQLNYRLREANGSWKIIDVYLNGTVSEVALRRSEYSSLIQREGFDALLTALDEKIADLAASRLADQSS